jgi:hypothetical protein
MGNPCGWEVGGNCSCATGCWTSRSPATRERAQTLAAHILWAATGRRYGLCEVTVLPSSSPPIEPLYQEWPLPSGAVVWPAVLGGNISGSCMCTVPASCAMTLPGPVASVVEVRVAGEPVDPGAYVVVDRSLLVRIDGSCWPTCNRVNSAVPGFEVDYERGLALPAAVQAAFDGLACQLARSCDGEACELPPQIRSLTRQGITIDMATEEAATQVGKTRTGIKWVDDVIAADNPYGLVEASQIHSLDLESATSSITWAGGS